MSHFRSVVAALTIAALFPVYANAGTTGGISGRVVDAATRAPLPDVTVSAVSPSQTATTTTDATGDFSFLSLAPDSYTVTFTKVGFDPFTQPGVTIFADQNQTLAVELGKTLKTIAHVQARSASSLLKGGTTSDVYSVNATSAQAAASLVGPGGLNSAYGAMASVPGVSIDAGEQGWFQTVHIRGGDIDQVGYELDGIPVNRAYDNAPMTMLSSLGQQELQVYTGGTPASADAQGISGYVNQVVKTGTYPGYGTASLGIGGPAFYHKASIEAGGATPDRLFSYYVGIGGENQDYRYIDNNNGASQLGSFFYPMNLVDPNTFAIDNQNGYVYTGANGTSNLFASGNAYGIANSSQRDTLMNFHFALPHHGNPSLRDDVQLLYLTSEVVAQYYSSQNDLGASLVNQLGQLSYDDSYQYSGQPYAPVNTSLIAPYYYPSSPQNRSFGLALPAALRDSNDNGVAIFKAQYQHMFSPRAFARFYAYSLYSNWFIYGPNTAAQPYYGAELADYEIPDHTSGLNFSFTDQINDQHLLTASASYTQSNLQRYDVGYIKPNWNFTNYVGSDGNCYDPASGAQTTCYGSQQGTIQNPVPTVAAAPPGSPGAQANAQWLVTNTNFNASLNQVHPQFTGVSLSDEWRPNDKITANIGVRVENFKYIFGNTGFNDPARAFWFAHYNAEYCYGPGDTSPQLGSLVGGSIVCPHAGEQTLASSSPLVNTNGGTYSVTRWQPRLGFTDVVNPDTVLRGSFGVYARPPDSSWLQYNVVQEDLPSYLGQHFYGYGFRSPNHQIRPDTSYNYDFSLEKHLKGTDVSFKLTPFYRGTRDQLQNFYIDPQGGLESGLNVGNQRSYGVEFTMQKGDFNHDGLSGQLSYTYTKSEIKYQNFSGTNSNVIDQLNGYIAQYNAYTKAGGGSPCYMPTTGTAVACGPGALTNPYYAAAQQPLMDRTAYYTTYDVIPGPFAGANGYAVPSVATLILNYRHQRFAVTPSFSYSSGAEYGSPTQWPGYMPNTCSGGLTAGAGPNGSTPVNPATCTDNGGLPLFLPDPYNNNQFDTLGAFKQPWRFSANIAFSYELTPRISTRLTLTNVVDHCGQRGYAWDNPNVCVYGSLPSGVLAPAGNFYPNIQPSSSAASGTAVNAPPVQLQYPYSFWLNNNNTGFVGVKIPMEFTFDVQVKL